MTHHDIVRPVPSDRLIRHLFNNLANRPLAEIEPFKHTQIIDHARFMNLLPIFLIWLLFALTMLPSLLPPFPLDLVPFEVQLLSELLGSQVFP